MITSLAPADLDIAPCKVCGASGRRHFLDLKVLGRYEVGYFFCDRCGLIQTEAPYWLDEAYQRAIADTDTGLVVRNVANARLLNVLLECWCDASGRFIDLAGGYGLLTRMLRDRGFDCWRSDKYCDNLFADGFEAPDDLHAEALFAFELMEHLPDPLAFLTERFERHGCRSLVFSTQTYEAQPPAADWWYYSPETGQHITFYQPRTLATLADRLGCVYTQIDAQWHIYSASPLPRWLSATLRRRRPRVWLESWMWDRQRRSLTWDDHLRAKRRLEAAADAAAATPAPSP